MQPPPSLPASALAAAGVGTGLNSAPRGHLSLDSGPKGRREARDRQHQNKSTNRLYFSTDPAVKSLSRHQAACVQVRKGQSQGRGQGNANERSKDGERLEK